MVNSAGKAIRRLSLRVHTLPTFTRRPGDVVLSWGEQLELVCEATGSPEPHISWMADGQPLTGAWAAGWRVLGWGEDTALPPSWLFHVLGSPGDW